MSSERADLGRALLACVASLQFAFIKSAGKSLYDFRQFFRVFFLCGFLGQNATLFVLPHSSFAF